MKLCRDWSCKKCGSGWLEEVGELSDKKEGITKYYCNDCKEVTEFEWKIRETSDPDEKLCLPAQWCFYCDQLMPVLDICQKYENYSHPVCNMCIENHQDGIEPISKYEVRDSVIVDGKPYSVVDKEFEGGEWVYGLGGNDIDDYTNVTEAEIIKYTEQMADIDGQD